MNIAEMVNYSLNALRYRSLRSWLTVLGIVVGITTIVVLIGLVQGLKDDITEQIKGFGANTIVVSPASSSGTTGPGSSYATTKGKLYLTDYERVKRLGGIEHITPVITGATDARYRDKELTISVLGIEPELFKQTAGTLNIEKGRFLTDSDRHVVVIGQNIAYEKFDEDLQISSPLYLEGQRFSTVGIIAKTGSSFMSLDDSMYIPLDDARVLFSDRLAENEISAIRITVKEGENPDEVADEINSIMLASHRVREEDKDFIIITASFINKNIDNVTNILSIFMGAIAGIPLLVGGVGITNTMFMSVIERTREIGTLKALGANEKDIQKLFLVESIMIASVGGLIGLAFAFVLIVLIKTFGGVPATFIPWVALAAILFSSTVGALAGYFPARRAARLDPVEALRYE
ncbi:MAG: ABC transporter permease [Candidatus Micrarchaeota archaeon]